MNKNNLCYDRYSFVNRNSKITPSKTFTNINSIPKIHGVCMSLNNFGVLPKETVCRLYVTMICATKHKSEYFTIFLNACHTTNFKAKLFYVFPINLSPCILICYVLDDETYV